MTVTQDFIFVPLPQEPTTSQILDFHNPEYGGERVMKLAKAIEPGELHELRETYPPMPVGQDPDVEQVIFVLHGIRQMGQWTDELEVSLREAYTRAKGFGGPARIKIIKIVVPVTSRCSRSCSMPTGSGTSAGPWMCLLQSSPATRTPRRSTSSGTATAPTSSPTPSGSAARSGSTAWSSLGAYILPATHGELQIASSTMAR